MKRIVKGTNHGNNNLIGVAVGAIVGAVVGAGVALLFAPRTGKESRDWLARSAREINDKAVSAFAQAEDTVQREKEIARREAKEIARVQDLNR